MWGGMVGSGKYTLPYDEGERTALLYQFFLMIEHGDVAFDAFCMNAYGKTNFQEMVWIFNEELVSKFAREVSYRLDEVLEDTADLESISSGAMLVFHHHDNSTVIHGDVSGSVVAAGGSTVINSKIEYHTSEDLQAALADLRPLVIGLTDRTKDVVEQALDSLIMLAASPTPSADEVSALTSSINGSAPRIGQRLKEIAMSMAGGLATSAIFEGIMAVLR